GPGALSRGVTTAAASRTSPGIITDHQIRPCALLTLLGQESEEGQVLGFRAQRRVTIARCRIGPAREIPAVTTTARSLKISQNAACPPSRPWLALRPSCRISARRGAVTVGERRSCFLRAFSHKSDEVAR